jgi:hypothetical protein
VTGVDERVVLLVPPDLAHQEDRVEHHAGDDQHEEHDPSTASTPRRQFNTIQLMLSVSARPTRQMPKDGEE